MASFARATKAWVDGLQRSRAAAASGILLLAAAAGCNSSPDHPPAVTGENPGGDQDATVIFPAVDASSPRGAPRDAGTPADASPPDALAACTSTQADANVSLMMCGTQCVNIETDNANCGACNQPCGIIGAACDHGTCKCPTPQSVCSNRCVDTTQDESNCGFCGHNCQGNPCTMSLCQASNIAQVTVSTTHIASIAVDSTNVYWTQGTGSGSGAYGKPFAGGTPVQFGTAVDPRGIVVDLTHVYWADFGNGTVSSAALLGGAPVRIAPPPDGGALGGPTALTSDAKNVYWVDPVQGTVNQMPLQGGTVLPLASGRLTPMAIAVDATNVYWVDYGSTGNPGSVNKVPIIVNPDSGTPTVTPLAPSEQQPSGIAIDAANVYWTDFDDNTVNKVPIGGGAKFQYAVQQATPSAIAVDKKNIYWVNHAAGLILEVTK